MTVAICGSTATPFQIENTNSSPTPVSSRFPSHTPANYSGSEGSGHFNCWSKINLQTPAAAVPYIHPLMQRSRPSMDQTSLDMCTESLGSETGSNDFDHNWFSMSSPYPAEDMTSRQEGISEVINERRDLLSSVNYHSTGRRSTTHSFPPPLPSISRRNGPCFRMRPRRCDSRLVVEVVLVPSQNFLQAHRHEGRLVLSFIETRSSHQSSSATMSSKKQQAQHQFANCEPENKFAGEDICKEDEDIDDDDEEEEEAEEVEVVDRGTIVEMKVSRQLQPKKGTKKILRLSIGINKFVGGTQLSNNNRLVEPTVLSLQRRMAPTTTTAAAAALAASSVCASPEDATESFRLTKNRLLSITKRRNREERLCNIQKCSQLQPPLFSWGPCCVATSLEILK